MNDLAARFERPELVFGFVAPIGADKDAVVKAFATYFRRQGYNVIPIKVTDIYRRLEPFIKPNEVLDTSSPQKRYRSFIKYGDQLRTAFTDDAFMASTAIARIVDQRPPPEKDSTGSLPAEHAEFSKNVYLLDQFKRREEIALLRSVYGEIFFQVSIYSRRGVRVDNLARLFAEDADGANINARRPEAEEFVRIDEDEVEHNHGQQVGKIFHMADFIVNLDEQTPDPETQVNRFCELLFSSNQISPTKMEHGMYLAQGAALRSLDLSRQVGVSILDKQGRIISLGANEVPKAGGGTYWADEEFDDRDYKRGKDSNEQRRREILAELLKALGIPTPLDEALKNPKVKNSQMMDALEYGRVIHAEMNAVCDAARLGRSCEEAILYTTTFPCHMCAKHVVAAGLDQVVFLEPYPKSLAYRLHNDSIDIEGGDRGTYSKFPSVKFVHFFGVTPRRYHEFFQRGRRKSNDGKGTFEPYKDGGQRPLVEITAPFYVGPEKAVLAVLDKQYEANNVSVVSSSAAA